MTFGLEGLFVELLVWLIPARALIELTDESFESIDARYKATAWHRRRNPIAILAFIGLTVIYSILFSALSALLAYRYAGAKFVVRPTVHEFVLMGFLLSMFSFNYICLLAVRWFIGRKEFEIYVAYLACDGGARIDARKMFKWIFLLTFPVLWVISALYAASFTVFTQDALCCAEFGSLSVPKIHPYTDIRTIYFAKSVHLRDRDELSPRYVIVFKNKYRWQSFGGTAEIPFEEQTAVARFVAQRRGLKIVSMNFVEDIPN